MKGWISLYRTIQNHWIWQDDQYLRWWLTILLNVNHEPKKFPVNGELFVCQPGQSFMSIQQWTDLFHCSKKTTIKFFELLKKDIMIQTEIVGKGNRRKHLLSVVNWAKYQGKETGKYTETVPECSVNGNPNVPPNKNNKNNKNNILLSKIDESILDEKEKEFYRISKSFFDLIKSNLVELKLSTNNIEKAKYEKWVSPIRLLIEKDKKTMSEIREVFKFLKEDDFWKEQIRTTEKLRKKNKDGIPYFDVLLLRSRNGEKRKNNQNEEKPITIKAKA